MALLTLEMLNQGKLDERILDDQVWGPRQVPQGSLMDLLQRRVLRLVETRSAPLGTPKAEDALRRLCERRRLCPPPQSARAINFGEKIAEIGYVADLPIIGHLK